jgi:hypothetical protein
LLDLAVIDTQDKAYLLGFISADGYITKNYKKLVISLSAKDHLFLCNLSGMLTCGKKTPKLGIEKYV